VLASAWVQQYARHVASELRGPVALLRLRSSEATLELVSGSGVIHQPHEPTSDSLAAALAAAAREAVSLLVRTEETTEPRLAELAGLDSLTLLSGADEAATVASYRTIKNLTARMDDEGKHPAIRLAIMGATATQAQDASAKIERAASAFLNKGVRVTACISKIGGGKSTPLFKGAIHEPVDSILRSLRREFTASTPRSTPLRSAAPPAQPTTSSVPASEAPRIAEPVVSRLGHLTSAPPPTTQAALPRLCDQVPGLTPAAFTCPYASEIEFAFDTAGSVHALGHLDHPSRALAQLLIASEWARAHDCLLRQASSRPLQGQGSITLHVFTGDARSSRLLPDTIRLHLLTQVHVAGHSTWFSTPLN